MKQLISDQSYVQALQRGRKSLEKTHAVSARYSPRTHRLTVAFSNGLEVAVDVRRAPVLRDHLDADFSDPYVTPGGDGLIFDKANIELGLPAFVGPLLPEDIARARVASLMGRASSIVKTAAARANGAKGGRPRREHAEAAKSKK